MPLILAIEPERQQAVLLSSLVRGRLRAELVLADTTEQALVAIGDRVPDLVLIPALLSAQEDAALAGALRMIAAAANVQMLTIPLLAAPAAAVERLGVLAKWRRSKRAVPIAAGCDPAVFAEQIASYLSDNGELTTGDAVIEADAPTPVVLATVVDSTAETSAVDVRGPSSVPRSFALIDWQGAPSDSAPTVTPAVSDVVVAEVEKPALRDVVEADAKGLALSDAMPAIVEAAAGIETSLVAELIDGPIVHAVAPPLDAVAIEAPSPETLVTGDADELTVARPSETVVVAGEPSFQEPAIEFFAAPRVEELAEVVVDLAETPSYDGSVGEPAADAALMASVEAMVATDGQPTIVDERVGPTPPPAVVAAVVARAPAKPDRSEWVELLESLRQDMARLKTERMAPMSVAVPSEEGLAAILAPDPGSQTRVASALQTPRRPTVPAKKAMRPVQDEWGLFDPNQCGFASLLAKLSEVTEGNDGRGSARQLNH